MQLNGCTLVVSPIVVHQRSNDLYKISESSLIHRQLFLCQIEHIHFIYGPNGQPTYIFCITLQNLPILGRQFYEPSQVVSQTWVIND